MEKSPVPLEGFEIEDKRIRVCIIEDNRAVSKLIEVYIEKSGGFELAGVAQDGKQGEELLNGADYDAAIIDIILPYKDGISILSGCKAVLNREFEKKVFVMLTGVSHEALIRSAYDSGADYLILKPFDIECLFEKIIELHQLKSGGIGIRKKTEPRVMATKDSFNAFIEELLFKLEIHSNLKGYSFLKAAVIKVIANKGVLNGITKILYPDLAKESGSTPACVERVIRHAISEAWTKENSEKYARLLSDDTYLSRRPSNKEFIKAAAEACEKSFGLC